MRSLKRKISFFILSFSYLFGVATEAQAQFAPAFKDTGTVVPDFPITDINGNKTFLYNYLDSGYTVAIEFFLTTCSICWGIHEEGLYERVYQNYGPQGKIAARKIMPIMIEFGDHTDDSDLHGRGSNTQGDWTSGANYPIMDLTPLNDNGVMDRVLRPAQGPVSIPTPTFMVICPNRKVVFTGEGAGALTEELLVQLTQNSICSKAPATNLVKIVARSSIKVYPIPVYACLNVDLEAQVKADVEFHVVDLLGKTFMAERISLVPGQQTISLDINKLSAGIYLLNIRTEAGIIQEKFVVE